MHVVTYAQCTFTNTAWILSGSPSGWATVSWKQTLIYAHADTEDKRKAIEAVLGGGVTGELRDAPYTVDDEEVLRKLYRL